MISNESLHAGDLATGQNRRDEVLSQILPTVRSFDDVYEATQTLARELGIDLGRGAMVRIGSIELSRVAQLDEHGRILPQLDEHGRAAPLRDANPFNPATVKTFAAFHSVSTAEAERHIAQTIVGRTGLFFVQNGTHDGRNGAEADRLVIFGVGGFTHTAPVAATATLLEAGYTRVANNTSGGLRNNEVVIGINRHVQVGDQFSDTMRPVTFARVEQAWQQVQ